jgi:nitroimidazol reductase NimA-like FMN-containing flavoprotein (pyridoxamine 5'-phosphate oxidase superfamily)
LSTYHFEQKLTKTTDPSAGIDEPLDCYIHGYVSSRIMNLARVAPEGLPVCIAATKVDGFVLSLTPKTHDVNFRSAMLYGYAKPVEEVAEKLYAMQLITNKVIPDRWAQSRTPPDGAEMQSTTILKITIVNGSGKVSASNAHDEAKDDTRTELLDRIWTGVVPVYETYGEPVPSGYNRIEKVPTNIADHIVETNETNEKYAIRAAQVEVE